jgi:hypothetical protein
MALNSITIDLPVGSAVGTLGSCAVISSFPVPSGLDYVVYAHKVKLILI